MPKTAAPSEFPAPGDGAGLTHEKSELTMSTLTPSSRPQTRIVELYDPKRDLWRPCVICYPVTGSYAVMHTAEDYGRHLKCKTEATFKEQIVPKSKLWWDAPKPVQTMVDKARRGEYDNEAEAAGYESPLSYALGLLEGFAERQGRSVVPALRYHRTDLTVQDVETPATAEVAA